MIKIFRRLFTEHPASVDENYFQHFVQAMSFSLAMLFGAVACMLHAFIPGLCVTRGSQTICSLHDRMVVNRRRVAAAEPRPV